MGLENRVVMITGATGALGRVVAKQFSARGARLALFGTNRDRLQVLAQELSLPADRLLTQSVDARNAGATRAATNAVLGKFGRVDILLNLVGGWTGGKSVVEFAASDVHEMLEQHLWTTFHLAQAVVPHLVANKWGRIIAVSSPHATHRPAHAARMRLRKPRIPLYCAP